MRATITVTGPTLHALSGALDITSGSIVTEIREGEGWEDDGAVTYCIVVDGEGETPDTLTPDQVAARTLAAHAIQPHWRRTGEQVAALIAEAVAADRATR